MPSSNWPPLPLDGWRDTYATLHLWSQVVGKVALAQAPPLNHSWGIALQLTSRGLSTPVLPHGDRSFTIEFDFIEHRLIVRACDGDARSLPLEPQTVKDFYRRLMSVLEEMSLPVVIWPVAVELPTPIRLDRDVEHASYDPDAAHRFWRVATSVARVLTDTRCHFIGKCSPAHFFWGAFDLALTRFSGRTAPPREGPAFMREAYSHEVISHGFWPGSAPVLEPALYAYAVPQPEGFADARIQPDAAYYHRELGEFILPYDAVRNAPSPDKMIRDFVASTYDAAATLAKWDRAALERQG
ncbi:MAG TPA: DUF5996 family protein [Vicinamibacterales bacterium]